MLNKIKIELCGDNRILLNVVGIKVPTVFTMIGDDIVCMCTDVPLAFYITPSFETKIGSILGVALLGRMYNPLASKVMRNSLTQKDMHANVGYFGSSYKLGLSSNPDEHQCVYFKNMHIEEIVKLHGKLNIIRDVVDGVPIIELPIITDILALGTRKDGVLDTILSGHCRVPVTGVGGVAYLKVNLTDTTMTKFKVMGSIVSIDKVNKLSYILSQSLGYYSDETDCISCKLVNGNTKESVELLPVKVKSDGVDILVSEIHKLYPLDNIDKPIIITDGVKSDRGYSMFFENTDNVLTFKYGVGDDTVSMDFNYDDILLVSHDFNYGVVNLVIKREGAECEHIKVSARIVKKCVTHKVTRTISKVTNPTFKLDPTNHNDSEIVESLVEPDGMNEESNIKDTK